MSDKAKIVVVDDDDSIRDLLTGYLRKNGYEVASCSSGEEFLDAFSQGLECQLLVLDIMMPGMDGYDVIKKLRETSKVPVIMLTAVSDEVDRIIGLELGADDYLAKPFNPRELLARIKAIMRRIDDTDKPVSESGKENMRYCLFKEYCLDTVSRHLTMPDGSSVNLKGTDYSLLMFFIGHVGQEVSRDDIARLTRNREALPMDRFIDVQISRLRHLLGEDARNPEIIKTVRGRGYVMATEVEFCAIA
ncbi:DNA-binding response regulator [Endozoicomonas sp. (ex Bugula neritina AB1)]|nr:DNA-binding response regulator [Endozoicomonas sp. (ex Bugula neritina AB1)]